MHTASWSFAVPALPTPVALTRWGHYGTPLVLFASAGGDSLEPEKLQLIQALAGLIDAGRVKVYAVAGTAVRRLLGGPDSAAQRVAGLAAFDDWVGAGLLAQVREDCRSDGLELLTCGCAFGAASALQALLRHPQAVRGAVGLSGTYDLLPWLEGAPQAAQVSPLQGPDLLTAGARWDRLRGRTVTLGSTTGDYEEPAAGTRMAQRLRAAGIATREFSARPGLNFGFAAWRELLPQLVAAWL